MPTAKKKDSPNFEKSLDELNALVEKMEQGDLPLEDALKHFEHGIKLIKQCQKTLQDAEQKVSILTEKNAMPSLEEFNDEP